MGALVRVVAIVQARAGSTRLPGKVLAALCGDERKGLQCPVDPEHAMVMRIVRRVQRAEMVSEVVVATSDEPQDDGLATLVAGFGLRVHRGPHLDVLSRYVGAARWAAADVIVRVTADCPLIEPTIIDRTVRSLRLSGYDFASTSAEGYDAETGSVKRTIPKGLDVEACWLDVLLRCDRMFASPRAREHVFAGIYEERPGLFLVRHIRDRADHGEVDWCVDTRPQLEDIRKIYISGRADLGYLDRIALEEAV